MQVTTEQIDPCKIALTISVEPDKVDAAKEKAFGQFARNLQLPGFRKGKVPPQMARTYVDEGRVRQRAAEMLIEPAYAEAVEETKVEPFAAPELELVEMNEGGPLVFKAFVPLRPVVTLGPYKGLAVERRRIAVTDADVERQLEELRGRLAEYQEVTDRTAQMGDIAFADLSAQIEGQESTDLDTPRGTAIEIGKNIPDFDNGLVGMAIGETKTIDAVYPETFAEESLRGKRATFTVTLKELRNRILPELDDELAKKIDPSVEGLDALKAKIRERLEKAADEIADDFLETRLVDEVARNSQISYPDVLLRQEMEHDAHELQERLERENTTMEEYLETLGKPREEVEREMAAAADRRIRNSLVLSQVAQQENVQVEDTDIDAQINERAERARVSPAAVRAFLEKNNQMEAVRNRALTEKVLDFLKGASQITEKVMTAEEMAAEEQAQDEAPAAADESAPAAGAAAAAPLGVEQAAPKRRGKKATAAEE